MENCKLYSDNSEDFIFFEEGMNGDINLAMFHSNKDGSVEKYYIVKERKKPFPPSKEYPYIRLRTAIGGGDYLINLLLKELMKRIQYLDEKKSGKYTKSKEKQEIHFGTLFEVLIDV